MTEAEARILERARMGAMPTPAETAATITSLEELDAYRKGLTDRGALTADAMAAIRDRQDEIRRRK